MRWKLWLILIVQAALVVLLAIAVGTGRMPLGIRGEWQWMRLPDGVKPQWEWFALAAAGVAAYAVFVGLGLRPLSASASRWAEARWLTVSVRGLDRDPGRRPARRPLRVRPDQVGLCELSSRLDRLLQGRPRAGRADPWQFLARYPDVDSRARIRCTSAPTRRV